LARAAAGATGIAFFSLSPADVYSSSYVGDAEAVIRRTFSLARSASPCILFFDEIDAIIGCSSAFSGDDSGLASLRRGSGDGGSDAELRVLSTFLNEMDGIDGSVEDGVLIFAATNRPHTLDAALLRPGRFDKVIYVPPPDKTGRRMILEAQCKKWGNWSEFDLDYLASDSVSANMTGAELVGACREAAMMAIRDALTFEGLSEALEPRVTNQHLESAMGNIKPLLADPQVMIPFLTFQSQV
jgi:SpoVK/Ycf46/Vps4 family AAA+-type ATPase